jgi:hypothetical protein
MVDGVVGGNRQMPGTSDSRDAIFRNDKNSENPEKSREIILYTQKEFCEHLLRNV